MMIMYRKAEKLEADAILKILFMPNLYLENGKSGGCMLKSRIETGLKVDARDESCVCDESRTWSR